MSLWPEFAAASNAAFKITLPFPPLLESWERSDHPSQVSLTSYRQSIAVLAAEALGQLEPPLALGFHVAGRPDISAGCDLDNFLTPVVKALGGDRRFALVWASRGDRSEASTLTLLRATDARVEMVRRPPQAQARLSESATSQAWKQAIAHSVGQHEIATRNGQVGLGIRFGVSPQRNWVTLWKPAIDSLGGILGEGDRAWHPRDDRISLLVLMRDLRPELAWNIELDVWWREPRVIC
ncbi:MAG: hypothetical protein JO023_22170 [Chloroflexi bacterium]|nr:hypothetical protein [Chloroflexota bacterium]